MIDAIIRGAIERRWLVLILVALLAALGVYNYQRLPIDAVPDITNVQVQINTAAPGYSPLEVEQRITFAIETALAGLPRLSYTRSLSQYGLSQVTAVFEDGTDIYFVRQLLNERLQEAKSDLPPELAPTLGPITTGLGEIYFYTVVADPDARQPDGTPYDSVALREVQDWIIRPQLRQVPGVAEVNTIGGYEKQYLVAPSPPKLLAFGVSLDQVIDALERNNASIGAGYVEQRGEQFLIRVPGQVKGLTEISEIIVANHGSRPVRIGDVAQVMIGRELRTGAATYKGVEAVIGTTIMLTGENSRNVAKRVAAKVDEIGASLPPGVRIQPLYDRTALVEDTIGTVQKNLAEGALLVIVVLFALLGNFRAALLTALVIPLSMLFLITGMVANQVSANLMSLGALDFGLIVDGAVIIVENCLLRLAQEQHRLGRALETEERFRTVFTATREVFRPSLISVIVVVLVNLPLFALTGVEGKMFQPMAYTVVVALLGALVFSITFVPATIALVLRGTVAEKENAIVAFVKRGYRPLLERTLARPGIALAGAGVLIIAMGLVLTQMGAEFIPNLDEGDVAVEMVRAPGVGLEQAVKMQGALDRAIAAVPEVSTVFTRMGTAEVASDPMPPASGDVFIMIKPRAQWPEPRRSKDEVLADLRERMEEVPGGSYELSQPIQLRFNELISGVRSELAIKVFGDDLDQLSTAGNRIAALVRRVPGAIDVKVEQLAGLPMLTIQIDRAALYRYGLNVADVQDVLAAALGGKEAGQVFEGDRRFDLVVRLPESIRSDLQALKRLPIAMAGGGYVPLGEVARLDFTPGPNRISRENGKRRLVVTANVEGRDLASFVSDVQKSVRASAKLPPGYWLAYGGTFEQLQSATARLQLLVPLTMLLVFGLLLLTFGSIRDALIVFGGVPLALTGGVAALALRGIPLSISAGVGFITLSGVAVLTGVVMVSSFRQLLQEGKSLETAISEGAMLRLRPIMMVALVASLGFLPMALNTGTGAEVQRPLATVVIGGILSSTLLSLFVLPALYRKAGGKSQGALAAASPSQP